MSLNITSSAEIHRHQTNTSPAKALFSFPKSERFRRQKSYTNAMCYEVNSSLNVRKSGRTLEKTTFGIQRPQLFFDKEQLAKPTPVTYRIKQNEFTNSYINRSFRRPKLTDSPLNLTTFGVGRDAFDHVVSATGFNYQPHDLKIPGPTSYQPSVSRQQHKYSMRPRTTASRKKSIVSFFSVQNNTRARTWHLRQTESVEPRWFLHGVKTSQRKCSSILKTLICWHN